MIALPPPLCPPCIERVARDEGHPHGHGKWSVRTLHNNGRPHESHKGTGSRPAQAKP